MQYIVVHTKGPQGWAQATIKPTTSKRLDAFEREWLEWMTAHNSDVVTIGETMIELRTIKH